MMFTSRDFKKSEYDNLIARERKPYTVHVGYDGLALITNRDNTDSCMSVKDVKRILSGEAKTWKEVGTKTRSGEIIVCFDNATSSAVHYVEDSILNGKPITAENAFATKKTAEVIDYVEKTPNAIGIIGSNWLNDKRDSTNLTWNKNIRVLAISRSDDATPTIPTSPIRATSTMISILSFAGFTPSSTTSAVNTACRGDLHSS
jgi:phosphate transport system substrate-binding protein